MSALPISVANAVGQVEHVLKRLENDQRLAEEALTRHIEKQLRELAKRLPRRKLTASSGMGSLSIEITGKTNWGAPDHHPNHKWIWIWNATERYQERGLFGDLCREWEALLDEFSERTGLEYVNFSETVEVRGALYTGD